MPGPTAHVQPKRHDAPLDLQVSPAEAMSAHVEALKGLTVRDIAGRNLPSQPCPDPEDAQRS